MYVNNNKNTRTVCHTLKTYDVFPHYRISSNKRRASNKCRPLISAALLGIHIEISAPPLNAALIRIDTKFY